MEKTDALKKLLHDLLAEQAAEIADDAPGINDQRLRETLRGNRTFNPEERRLLLQSPATRERFAQLAQLERLAARRRQQREDYHPGTVGRLAAADGRIHPLHEKQAEFELHLLPMDPAGERWKMTLKLFRPEFYPTGVKLVDNGDLTWLAGFPDSQGVITGFWERDMSLWERIHDYSLELAAL